MREVHLQEAEGDRRRRSWGKQVCGLDTDGGFGSLLA